LAPAPAALESAAASAAAAAALLTLTLTLILLRPGFIHGEGLAQEFPSIEFFNRLFGVLFRFHFHEPETPGEPGVLVLNDIYGDYLAYRGKIRSQVLFDDLCRQIPNIEVFIHLFPSFSPSGMVCLERAAENKKSRKLKELCGVFELFVLVPYNKTVPLPCQVNFPVPKPAPAVQYDAEVTAILEGRR
jgi:hypothetical protein